MGKLAFKFIGFVVVVGGIFFFGFVTGGAFGSGMAVDQFEQHIRAVAGWPLGPTQPHHHVEMTNLLGADVDAWKKLAAEPETRVHLYGKGEARPGRKMGHVNRLRPLRD